MKASWILLIGFLALAPPTATRAQSSQPQARKFDEFTAGIGSLEYRYGNYERHEREMKTRLALYAKELRRVGARPYAITYSPRVVPWESYDESIAERRAGALWELTPFFDWRNINIVNGGFREIATTELWIVPPNAQPPCPTPTVRPENVEYCPQVRVEGVLYVPHPTNPIEFKADVTVNSEKVRPRYSWQVSQGEIVDGPGTDRISVVVPAGSSGELVARVRLEGFSLECPVESTSGVFRTAYGLRHYLFEEFGNINCEDEAARLDSLAVTLQSDPALQVHIVMYGGRFGPRNEALARAARMKSYLIMTRGLEADRILTLDGGYRNQLSSEWWLSLRGTDAPATRPTVDKRYVKPKGQVGIVNLPCRFD